LSSFFVRSIWLARLQKAWSKANDDDRQVFLTWVAETQRA
jgi:hypothetical protein